MKCSVVLPLRRDRLEGEDRAGPRSAPTAGGGTRPRPRCARSARRGARSPSGIAKGWRRASTVTAPLFANVAPAAKLGRIVSRLSGTPLCVGCYYAYPLRSCGSCGRVRPIARRARSGDPDLCDPCAQPPIATCTLCGTRRRCHFVSSGRPICIVCRRVRTRFHPGARLPHLVPPRSRPGPAVALTVWPSSKTQFNRLERFATVRT